MSESQSRTRYRPTLVEPEPLGGLSGPLDPSFQIVGGNGSTLLDYSRWGFSDVLSNGTRGVLGEYLVAVALGVTDRPQVEWDAVDLRYQDWLIEVKTASAYQAWPLASGSKASAPRFSVRSSKGWDAATGANAPKASRAAHCYVLCVYLGPAGEPVTNHERRIAVLDVRRWQFYVVATAEFNNLNQKSIALSKVADRWHAVGFDDLAPEIRRIVAEALR